MPLTELYNRETVQIELSSSKDVTVACVAKNTIINATLLFGEHIDPYDDVTFPVTINGIKCDATIATSLDGLTSIDFIIAGASLPNDTERATYVFSVKRDATEAWGVGDKVVLSHDTETDEGFYGLLKSEQLRLLGY